MSFAYRPQTDDQIDWTIQSLEDLPRACILEKGGAWIIYFMLIECTCNNNFHAIIRIAPYESLYRRERMTPLCWYESGKNVMLGPETVQ